MLIVSVQEIIVRGDWNRKIFTCTQVKYRERIRAFLDMLYTVHCTIL